MPSNKKTVAKAVSSSVRVKGRAGSRRPSNSLKSASVGRFVVPLFIISFLLCGTLYIVLSGYETATASAFFGLRSVYISGTVRSSKDEISRVVLAAVERPGVWNADLDEIRIKIEKFPFVKSAAVSMNLPASIRISVAERTPAAIVSLSSGKYLVDTEGIVLIPVKAPEKDFPFVLNGWDESKTEKAGPDNLARLKIYKKMLDETSQFDVATKVKELDLKNPRQPVAVVEDSGHAVNISLAKDSLGKSLKTAIEALTGKGAKVKSVDSGGIYPIMQYIDF